MAVRSGRTASVGPASALPDSRGGMVRARAVRGLVPVLGAGAPMARVGGRRRRRHRDREDTAAGGAAALLPGQFRRESITVAAGGAVEDDLIRPRRSRSRGMGGRRRLRRRDAPAGRRHSVDGDAKDLLAGLAPAAPCPRDGRQIHTRARTWGNRMRSQASVDPRVNAPSGLCHVLIDGLDCPSRAHPSRRFLRYCPRPSDFVEWHSRSAPHHEPKRLRSERPKAPSGGPGASDILQSLRCRDESMRDYPRHCERVKDAGSLVGR